MEKQWKNIGQANAFHDFLDFPGFLAGLRRFLGNPGIHGKHWPGQCFPVFFHRDAWKTLARPMFSMNFWIFLDFGIVPGYSLENHQFMENISQAEVFHLFFFHRNSWNILAKPIYSMILGALSDSIKSTWRTLTKT